jgi:hypothetical protein
MADIKSKHKPKVFITDKLMSQIFLTHFQCDKGKEWSSLLVYRITKGSFKELEKLEIECTGMYPMDHGSAGFTTFEAGPDWFKAFKQYPEVDPMKPQEGYHIGKIHSHHSMTSYHSETDKGDLRESSPNFPAFLSVVVNYATNFDCQLAIALESVTETHTKRKWKFRWEKTFTEELKQETKDTKDVLMCDCEVAPVSEAWIVERNEELSKSKPTKTPVSPNVTSENGNTKNKGPKVYPRATKERVMENLHDLISLGITVEKKPFLLHKDIGIWMYPSMVESYKKAFKVYFSTDWADTAFADAKDEPILGDVIGIIQDWLRDSCASMWLTTYTLDALNDLQKEYSELRKIQRSSVVPGSSGI